MGENLKKGQGGGPGVSDVTRQLGVKKKKAEAVNELGQTQLMYMC